MEFVKNGVTIRHCIKARETLDRIISKHQLGLKTESIMRKFSAALERLCERPISSERLTVEAELPSFHGRGGGRFYAFKEKPLRVYMWRSQRFEDTWYISHYIVKDQQELSETDKGKVHANWYRVEVEGYEY